MSHAQDYPKKGRYRLNYKAEGSHHCSHHSSLCNEERRAVRTGCGLHSHNTACRRGHASVSREVIRRNTEGCGCKTDNGFLNSNTPIAMVYFPMQQWKELYDPYTALSNGTIFKELDLPFYPTPCRRKESSNCQYR